jgi:hypothetical protein
VDPIDEGCWCAADPTSVPLNTPQHMHTVVGGSQFSKDYDYETALTSSCTTAPVNIDFRCGASVPHPCCAPPTPLTCSLPGRSNYWAPTLYYYDPSVRPSCAARW